MKNVVGLLSLAVLVGAVNVNADQFHCSTSGGRLHVLVRNHVESKDTRTASILVISDTIRQEHDFTLVSVKAERKELSGNGAHATVDMVQALKEKDAVKNPNLKLFKHLLKSYKTLAFEVGKSEKTGKDFKFGEADNGKNNPYAATLSGVLSSDEAVKGVKLSCLYSTKAELEAESKDE